MNHKAIVQGTDLLNKNGTEMMSYLLETKPEIMIFIPRQQFKTNPIKVLVNLIRCRNRFNRVWMMVRWDHLTTLCPLMKTICLRRKGKDQTRKFLNLLVLQVVRQ